MVHHDECWRFFRYSYKEISTNKELFHLDRDEERPQLRALTFAEGDVTSYAQSRWFYLKPFVGSEYKKFVIFRAKTLVAMYGAKGSKHYNRPKKEEVVTDRKLLHRKNLKSFEKIRIKYEERKAEKLKRRNNLNQEKSDVTQTSDVSSKRSSARPLSSRSCGVQLMNLAGQYSVRGERDFNAAALMNDLSRSKSDMNLATGHSYEDRFPKISRFPTIANNATLVI